ncbi:MAG: rhodanese-like domain-containing protein [bacterium]|nr:rhodanese-like domain-containing protein [bacterium]
MSRFRRAVLLSLAALAAGLIVNQFHPEGIPGRMTRALFMSGRPFRRVSPDSAMAAHQRGAAVFVDIRDPREFRAGRIPGAENHPIQPFFRDFAAFQKSHPVDTAYIFYCFEPACREGRAMLAWMRRAGYRRVAWMYGGLSEWTQNRWPVETGEPNP